MVINDTTPSECANTTKETLQMQSRRLNTKLTHIPIGAQSRKKETFKSNKRQQPAIAMITVKTAVLHRL